jgi:hypothetical protein
MTCQIRIVNLPTCRTAISRKTAARMMTAMYVDQRYLCRLIGVANVGAGHPHRAVPATATSNLKYSRAEPASWIIGS